MYNNRILFILSFLFTVSNIYAQNTKENYKSEYNVYKSFHPGKKWLDNNGVHINAHGGGFIFYEGTYYWFGEHKIEGEKGNRAQVGVHCYSSKDLYNWKDEGIALKVSENPQSPIAKNCVIERPKVVYNKKTNKFVMWFHLENKISYTASLCGVATSDNIKGPYTFIKAGRVNPGYYPVNFKDIHKLPVPKSVYDLDLTGGYLQIVDGGNKIHPDDLNIIGRDLQGGQMSRDQTVFVDEDGKAYRIYASETNSTLHIAELSEDYTEHTGKYVRALINRYMEAPAIFKKDGLYYLMASGCTGWAPNAARSAVAPSIWGPWQELGNPCIGNNADISFNSQSTYILPVNGKKDSYIYIGDRWEPANPIDGTYIWLPIEFNDGKFQIKWYDQWSLEFFNK